jgi:hypothetical protein
LSIANFNIKRPGAGHIGDIANMLERFGQE